MTKGPFRRRLKWSPGDLFAVPLSDGTFGLVQAIAPVEKWAVDFALLACRLPKPELAKMPESSDAVGVCASWRTAITGGHLAFVGHCELLIPMEACPNQQLIAAGAIGVTHVDWGLLQDFLSAYHGLFPWNLYPAFEFDSYLLQGVVRPAKAIVLTQEQVILAAQKLNERGYAN